MKTITIEFNKNTHTNYNLLSKTDDFGAEYISIRRGIIDKSWAIYLKYYINTPIPLYSTDKFQERLNSPEQPENQEFPLHIKFHNYENILFFMNTEHRTRCLRDIMNIFDTFKMEYIVY